MRWPANRWPADSSSARIILDAKGIKRSKLYDPDVVEMAKKTQDPSKDLWGFGQTLNRSDDGNGFMQHILWAYGGSAWDKEGKPALGTSFLKQNMQALQFAVDTIQKHKIQPPGVMALDRCPQQRGLSGGQAGEHRTTAPASTTRWRRRSTPSPRRPR